MRKHLRLLRTFFQACLAEEFEYRTNLIGNLLSTLMSVLTAFLTLQLFFYRTTSIGGWGFYEVLALLGVFTTIQGFIAFFLAPNMSRMIAHIREGTLDFILLKPVDSQFFISFRHLVFWRLSDVAIGVGLTLFAALRMETTITLSMLLAFLAMGLSALGIVYALWIGIMICSFWAVKVDNLSFLFQSFFETARFPVSAYPRLVRVILTTLFPVAMITTVPAQAILGKLHWPQAIGAVFVCVLLLSVTRLFWKKALRFYSSASS